MCARVKFAGIAESKSHGHLTAFSHINLKGYAAATQTHAATSGCDIATRPALLQKRLCPPSLLPSTPNLLPEFFLFPNLLDIAQRVAATRSNSKGQWRRRQNV